MNSQEPTEEEIDEHSGDSDGQHSLHEQPKRHGRNPSRTNRGRQQLTRATKVKQSRVSDFKENKQVGGWTEAEFLLLHDNGRARNSLSHLPSLREDLTRSMVETERRASRGVSDTEIAALKRHSAIRQRTKKEGNERKDEEYLSVYEHWRSNSESDVEADADEEDEEEENDEIDAREEQFRRNVRSSQQVRGGYSYDSQRVDVSRRRSPQTQIYSLPNDGYEESFAHSEDLDSDTHARVKREYRSKISRHPTLVGSPRNTSSNQRPQTNTPRRGAEAMPVGSPRNTSSNGLRQRDRTKATLALNQLVRPLRSSRGEARDPTPAHSARMSRNNTPPPQAHTLRNVSSDRRRSSRSSSNSARSIARQAYSPLGGKGKEKEERKKGSDTEEDYSEEWGESEFDASSRSDEESLTGSTDEVFFSEYDDDDENNLSDELEKWLIRPEELSEESCVGNSVLIGWWKRKKVAIKYFPNKLVLDQRTQKHFDRELQAFTKTNGHPHLLEFHGVCLSRPLRIVMEAMDCNLAQYLQMLVRPVELAQYIRIATHIAKGVAYLHSLDMVHRDIKPENILVLLEGNEVTVKVADFGLTKVLSDTTISTRSFTPFYAAPEILGSRARYLPAADVYSVGMVYYVMACGGYHPWDRYAAAKAVTRILQGHRPDISKANSFGGRIQRLIQCCWDHDSDRRPNCNQILQELEACSNIQVEDIPKDGSASPSASLPHLLSLIKEVIELININVTCTDRVARMDALAKYLLAKEGSPSPWAKTIAEPFVILRAPFTGIRTWTLNKYLSELRACAYDKARIEEKRMKQQASEQKAFIDDEEGSGEDEIHEDLSQAAEWKKMLDSIAEREEELLGDFVRTYPEYTGLPAPYVVRLLKAAKTKKFAGTYSSNSHLLSIIVAHARWYEQFNDKSKNLNIHSALLQMKNALQAILVKYRRLGLAN